MKSLLSKRSYRLTFLIAICSLIFVTLFLREWNAVENEPIQSWTTGSQADCGIVLTGGAHRVREGFDLLSRSQIRKLIISGVHADVQMRDLLPLWNFYGDLNEKDVILEKRSLTTYGNAQQTLPLVEALKCRDVILITSKVHMNRAYKTFRQAFPEEIPIIRHSVSPGQSEGKFFETVFEVLKTLFYALWAF